MCASTFSQVSRVARQVADWSDADIWALNRGGHDPHRSMPAYQAAVNHKGRPRHLAKTIRDTDGNGREAMNITHQQKKMDVEAIRRFRDRFRLPVPTRSSRRFPTSHSPKAARNWSTCAGTVTSSAVTCPERAARRPMRSRHCRRSPLAEGTDDREISTTMASCRCCRPAARQGAVEVHRPHHSR